MARKPKRKRNHTEAAVVHARLSIAAATSAVMGVAANVLAILSIEASYILLGTAAFTIVVLIVFAFMYRDPREDDDETTEDAAPGPDEE